jgi:SAM-dependent methyltransferase
VDLHPLAVQASRRVSTRVAQASVQALPFPAETFDLVTSFEVLYHLAVTDDTAALREYARLLKPGGWLMVRVPAHNWLRGAHDRQVHTRHRYAAGELRQKLEAAGFCIQRLSPVGLWLLPAAMLRRWLQPHPAAQTDVVLPPAPINAALTWLLGLEGLWLRYLNLPGGLSLLALARKKA